jgi:hypothetical protein
MPDKNKIRKIKAHVGRIDKPPDLLFIPPSFMSINP